MQAELLQLKYALVAIRVEIELGQLARAVERDPGQPRLPAGPVCKWTCTRDGVPEIPSLDRLKWNLAALRFQLALWRFEKVRYKGGFDHSQRRVPAGDPRGGQWTSGEIGTVSRNVTEFSAQGRKSTGGHHFLPRAVYQRLELPAETRKVFDDATTGPLRVVHGWDEPHANYNAATNDLLDRFMKTNNIDPERMTPDQARSLLKEIQESHDPRIRNFNMRIRFREQLFRLRSGVRGNE